MRFDPSIACSATLLACAAWTGCTGSYDVGVNVRTDYLPGVEFLTVRTRVEDLPAIEHAVDPTVIYADGVRVADLPMITGRTRIDVELLDEDARIVGGRPIVVTVGEALEVTAVITRDCVDVDCPVVDERARACHGGTCVDALCTEEAPIGCTTEECAGDMDCMDASLPGCIVPRCIAGACLLRGVDGRCRVGEICHPELGCRPAENVDRCAEVDPDTVLQLAFDDDLADAAGGAPAVAVGETDFTEGPLGCGNALAIPSAEVGHVELADDNDWHLAEGSVEVWFRPTVTGRLRGIVTRDQRTRGNGHFSLFMTPDDVVVVHLQNASGEDAWRCSEPLEQDAWHHLGVSFGPSGGLELWVDGALANLPGVRTVEDAEGSFEVPCGQDGVVSLRPADALPWVVGANGLRADDAMDWSDHATGCAIDYLRISRVRRDFDRTP